MMVLIIGGSGSGKSAYAEEYASRLAGDKNKYYIATMQVFDEEGLKKIERHQRLRRGRGFETIEQASVVENAIQKIDNACQKESTVLLECMSNLAANEMFKGEVPLCCETVTERIVRGVEQLRAELEHLVIVTNNVFEDGIAYDETTTEYIKAMGGINSKLADMADKVVEVVVGIPVAVKEGN